MSMAIQQFQARTQKCSNLSQCLPFGPISVARGKKHCSCHGNTPLKKKKKKVVGRHCFAARGKIESFSSSQKTVATTDHLGIQLWEALECQAEGAEFYWVENAEYKGETYCQIRGKLI